VTKISLNKHSSLLCITVSDEEEKKCYDTADQVCQQKQQQLLLQQQQLLMPQFRQERDVRDEVCPSPKKLKPDPLTSSADSSGKAEAPASPKSDLPAGNSCSKWTVEQVEML
jgi:hypothetical protein